MRPTEACRLIDKEMCKFYKASVTDLPDLSILQCFKKKRVYQALKQLETRSERVEREICKFWDLEFQPTEAYYSDDVSVKEILGQFHYISDRWNCAGRIRFILRCIDNLE